MVDLTFQNLPSLNDQSSIVAAGKLSSSSIIYVIKVERGDKIWWISRCFAEFHALRKAIQATLQLAPCKQGDLLLHQVKESFPRTSWFPFNLDERAKRLDQFLQILLLGTTEEECQVRQLVKQFLLVYSKSSTPVYHINSQQQQQPLAFTQDDFDPTVPIQSPLNSRLRPLRSHRI